MNKTQKGFAAFETLLLIIIVAVIGGVGWYTIHTKHQTDKILSQADEISKSTPVSKKSASSSNSTSTSHSPSEAVNFVQVAYNQYVQASTNKSTGEPAGREVALDAIKSDLTTAYYNQVKTEYAIPSETNGSLNPNYIDYDLITCAQNTLNKPNATLKSSTASNATVTVSDSTYQPPSTLDVTVNLSALFISNVSCPGK